jgi:DNA-binding PadR family transcriptional regulator
MNAKVRVLERIAQHNGEWGWYQLERCIAPIDFPPGTVMTVLKQLQEERLIIEVHSEPMNRYKVTEKGRAQLRQNR